MSSRPIILSSRGGSLLGRPARGRWAGSGDHASGGLHRRYETVATAGDIGDVALAVFPVTQSLAKIEEMNPETSLLDNHVGPDKFDQLSPAQDFPGVLHQTMRISKARPPIATGSSPLVSNLSETLKRKGPKDAITS